MERKEKAKGEPQSTVRIYAKTKKDIQSIVHERVHIERRAVTEIELVDPVVARWARREKRKLGIK